MLGEICMKQFKVIKTPESFKLLADKTRRRMIYLLRAKERTVSQIAEELERTPQAIYHHIRQLRDADMIEVAREERIDHFIETYYQATAEVFYVSHGEEGKEYAEKEAKQALESLPKLGFNVTIDEETVSKLVDLKMRIEEIGSKGEFEEQSGELDDVDFLTKQSVGHYAKLLAMSDKEFDEHVKLEREFRDLLRSTLAKKITN